MSKYSLSTERLLSLVPISLRKTNLMCLLRCLLNPVSYLHMEFTIFREKKEYRLSHTGQVYSLTQVVCDYCGDDRCTITDGTYIEEVFVPSNAQGELINFQVSFPSDNAVEQQVWVPSEGMSHVQQADFKVCLPQSLYGAVDELGLRAIIDEYKLAGKQYVIVYENMTVEYYSFEWSNGVCALELEPVVETYNFEWKRLICVLDKTYDFAWSNLVCVRDCDYTFAWSNVVCAKKYTTEHYEFSWSNLICTKQAEAVKPYTFAWSSAVCVKVSEEPYKYEWSAFVCRQVKEGGDERE